MSLLRYFYSAYPARTIIVCITTTIAGTLTGLSISALLPLLSKILNTSNTEKNIFDRVFDQLFSYIGVNPSVESLLMFIVVTIILKSVLLSATNIYARFTVAKAVKDLRKKLLAEMSRAEWKFFTNQSSGKLAASLMSETSKAGLNYIISLDILSTLVQILIILIISFFISWQIVLLTLVSSIALAILLNKLISINRLLGDRNTSLMRKTIHQLTDSLRSIKSLKAMSRESSANALLDNYTKELKQVDRKIALSTQALSAFQEIFLIGIIVIGIYLAMNTLEIPVESVLFLSFLFIRSMKLVGKTQKKYQQFQGQISGFEGIMESINTARSNREVRNGELKHSLQTDIHLNNISFSYEHNSIFDNANATIYYKRLNSIVGPSGVGKTTLVDLICGLYIPLSGEIFIGNKSLKEIDIHYWRKQIGYVVQDNTLLNSSIRDNITLGDSTLTDQAVNLALRKAHAEEFINALPTGIETPVGENGTKLSGGQRQRILIARALVHSPTLLILDEATSALDEDTEDSLSKIFKELSKEITIISISHRPALIAVSDNVIQITHKKLVEK